MAKKYIYQSIGAFNHKIYACKGNASDTETLEFLKEHHSQNGTCNVMILDQYLGGRIREDGSIFAQIGTVMEPMQGAWKGTAIIVLEDMGDQVKGAIFGAIRSEANEITVNKTDFRAAIKTA